MYVCMYVCVYITLLYTLAAMARSSLPGVASSLHTPLNSNFLKICMCACTYVYVYIKVFGSLAICSSLQQSSADPPHHVPRLR